jgi:hypothetical protein
MRPVPHREELSVLKPPENLTLSDDNSDSDEDHGQQGGNNVDCDKIFDASCYSSEPHLFKKDFNGIVRVLNLSKKKQAELLNSRINAWNLLHQILKYVSFQLQKSNQRIFLSNDLVFLNDICCIMEALGHQNTI